MNNEAPVTLRSIAVGLGELSVSSDPGNVLVAYGLGSCVAVAVYDPVARVAGLLHAMLPQRNGTGDTALAKYVDSGIAHLMAELARKQAGQDRLIVRIVGGANMLLNSPGLAHTFNIGDRNVTEARAALAALRLRIRAEEVGGNTGRTMRLYVADGRMTVRMMGLPEREI